jgi:diguanylate cyclase (GGDEF)-like protein
MHFDYSTQLTAGDTIETCTAGEIIFATGQPGDVMYVVKSGTVQILVGDRVFDIVGAGQTMGEMAILDDAARSATARALTDCEIVAIDKQRLLEMVQREPLVAIAMTRSMVRRLRSMNYQAQYDLLTDLPNRTLFREQCQAALQRSRRQGTLVGILQLDLDHFAMFNDSLGYAAADMLLGQVAGRLRSALRQTDTLARLGADEFSVLVEGVRNDTNLAVAAQRLQESLASPIEVEGSMLYVTASIGISCHPSDGTDVETLLKNADSAMRVAKQGGRNQYVFFSQDFNDKALLYLTTKSALREAIDHGELVLHYQPRVDLVSGTILGVEALLRWFHPKMGSISPADFIPLAEETGLIDAIGTWVLREGCRQRKAWLDAGLESFRVAINLSTIQMRHPHLVDNIRSVLAETGLPAEYVELEVTESVLIENPAAVVEKLQAFRAMGMTIALDDFGTGYSSLSYIKRFPLDYMKIDQSFVRGIPHDASDVAITRTIVALARNLGVKTVVEGIETEEQLTFARAEGCDEFQGYLFSKAVSAEAFELLLRDKNSQP